MVLDLDCVIKALPDVGWNYHASCVVWYVAFGNPERPMFNAAPTPGWKLLAHQSHGHTIVISSLNAWPCSSPKR